MKILIAANARMRPFVDSCLLSIQRQGHSVIVYDLGGLGFGKKFEVNDPTFQAQGFYHSLGQARFAPGEHKPAVIRDCLQTSNELIVYVDADTLVLGRLDEMAGDYDVGLTVRPAWEIEKLIKSSYPNRQFIYDGYVNTGIMCFYPTANSFRFLDKWQEGIKKIKDEQGAINGMLEPMTPLKSNITLELDGIKLRLFDTMQYNYYYFYSPRNCHSYPLIKNDITVPWHKAKILHFKGKMRHEYKGIINHYRLRHIFQPKQGIISLLKNILRSAIVHTNAYWPFSDLNRLPYAWALQRWLKICRKYPQIKSVYLKSSMVQGNWIAGLSDIDLTIVIDHSLRTEDEFKFLTALWKDYKRLQFFFPMLGEMDIYDDNNIKTWNKVGIRGYESRRWKLLLGEETIDKDYEVPPDILVQDALDNAFYYFKVLFWKEFFISKSPSLDLQRIAKKVLKYIHYRNDRKCAESLKDKNKNAILAVILKELENKIHSLYTRCLLPNNSTDKNPVISVLSCPKGIFRYVAQPVVLVIIKDGLDIKSLENSIDEVLKRFTHGAIMPLSVFDYMVRVQDPLSYEELKHNAHLEEGINVLSSMAPPTQKDIKRGAVARLIRVLNFYRREKFFSQPPSRLFNSFLVEEILTSKLYLEKNILITDRQELLKKYEVEYPEYFQRIQQIRNSNSKIDAFSLIKKLSQDVQQRLSGLIDGL